MEREFLLGIDFGLYVDKATYLSWLNLLKGLVLAKEKDSRHWRRSPRGRCVGQPRAYRSSTQRSFNATRSQRARSSSPNRVSTVYATTVPQCAVYPAAAEAHTPPRPGNKRSATDAFSPTSTSFPPVKQAKRPNGLSLDIPERQQGPPSAHSISPSEPLQSFSKLSLGTSPNVVRSGVAHNSSPAWPSTQHQSVPPRTLASEYRVDEQRTTLAPQVCGHGCRALAATDFIIHDSDSSTILWPVPLQKKKTGHEKRDYGAISPL